MRTPLLPICRDRLRLLVLTEEMVRRCTYCHTSTEGTDLHLSVMATMFTIKQAVHGRGRQARHVQTLNDYKLKLQPSMDVSVFALSRQSSTERCRKAPPWLSSWVGCTASGPKPYAASKKGCETCRFGPVQASGCSRMLAQQTGWLRNVTLKREITRYQFCKEKTP